MTETTTSRAKRTPARIVADLAREGTISRASEIAFTGNGRYLGNCYDERGFVHAQAIQDAIHHEWGTQLGDMEYALRSAAMWTRWALGEEGLSGLSEAAHALAKRWQRVADTVDAEIERMGLDQ